MDATLGASTVFSTNVGLRLFGVLSESAGTRLAGLA